jgi:DNA helicase-2/ATP-dependent DNA helicase PcrA
VAHLVEAGADPASIAALTFTRFAASELRRRVRDRVGEDRLPEIRTLHSFALQQLLKNGVELHGAADGVRVADDWEERWLVLADLKRWLDLPEIDAARDLLAQMSAGWQRLDADDADWERSFPDPRFIGALGEHQRRYRYVLRSELVYRLRREMELRGNNFNIPHYEHLLVDEYQDLNRCDLDVVRRLSAAGAELFVAGDDDQSIYSFRYAHPEGIRRFIEDYDAVPLSLTICRRCGPAILDVASFVIQQDFDRIPKELRPQEGKLEGLVRIVYFDDQLAEARGIAKVCRFLIDDRSMTPGDILILLRNDRNGSYSGPIVQALVALGVPVNSSTDETPLESDAGQRVVAGLRLIRDANDDLAWSTLIRTERGIGPERIAALDEHCQRQGTNFSAAVREVPREGVLASVAVVVDRITEQLAALNDEGNQLSDVIDHVTDSFAPEDDRPPIRAELGGLVELLGLADLHDLLGAIEDQRSELEQDLATSAVNVMTMHRAKGLTARCTIVAAAEDELIPGRGDLAEERRLLYVSLTRAQERLLVTYALKRSGSQLFSGRNGGVADRHLTHYLQDARTRPRSGAEFVAALEEAPNAAN